MKLILNDKVRRRMWNAAAEDHARFEFANNLSELVHRANVQRWRVAVDFFVDGPNGKCFTTCCEFAICGIGRTFHNGFSWGKPPIKLSTTTRTHGQLLMGAGVTGLS